MLQSQLAKRASLPAAMADAGITPFSARPMQTRTVTQPTAEAVLQTTAVTERKPVTPPPIPRTPPIATHNDRDSPRAWLAVGVTWIPRMILSWNYWRVKEPDLRELKVTEGQGAL